MEGVLTTSVASAAASTGAAAPTRTVWFAVFLAWVFLLVVLLVNLWHYGSVFV